MLNSFRSIAGSFWAKILLILLVISFGVWGIGDMLRGNNRNPVVANVGNMEITSVDYLRAMHQETENLRRMMGDNYNPEIAKNPNLSHWVMQKLINNALMKQETEALGFVPSDSDIVRRIRANPDFQDSKGNFDKTIFETRLKNANASEKLYVEQLRQDTAIAMLVETLTAATPVPEEEVRTLMQAREQQRSITLYDLNTSLISNVPQPTVEQIKAYYDAHTHDFTAPEYRTLSYMTLTSADIPKDEKTTEEDLKQLYNERIDEFKRDEQRNVEQLLYGTEEKAKAAKEMLKAGKSFDAVAKETVILNKGATSMGKIDRTGLIDNAADTVFSLASGASTDPIQSPFGWHIFHVISIVPPTIMPFEEARPILEKDMKQHGSDKAMSKLANKIEDMIAGGNTLQETAKEFKLKIVPIPQVNHLGQNTDGTSSKAVPAYEKFLDIAFKTDEKSESQMMTSKGGVFYIVRVDSVTPEHLRTLDEVKPAVIAACQTEEREKRLFMLAKEIASKFNPASSRIATIEKYNLQPKSTATIKHSSKTIGDVMLPPSLLTDIFTRKAGEGTDAYAGKKGEYLIAEIVSISAAPPIDKDAKMTTELTEVHHNLEGTVQNELLDQYARYLMTKYPVLIHEAVLETVSK